MKKFSPNYKYLNFLSMLYVTILLISVLLDYKFISIGEMLASSATFVISLTFFLSDVIAEVYGYRTASKIVFSGIICLMFFSIVGFLMVQLSTPEKYADYAHAYNIIFTLLFRSSLANTIAMLAGAFFNVYFVTKWKVLVKGKYFWLRCLGSSAIGEALYTIFVVSLVNVGIVPFIHLIDILIISYLFKIIFNTFAVIPTSFLASFLKRTEGVDIYDFPKEFTPFKYMNLNIIKNNNG